MTSRDQIIRRLSSLEGKLRAGGVTRMALVGSRARADHRPDSDVDVVIDVQSDIRFSLIDLVGVAQEIEDETELSANVFMRRSLDPAFLAAVERDAVSIF